MATPVDGRQKTWFCLREAAPVFLVPRSRRENQGVFASSSGLAVGLPVPSVRAGRYGCCPRLLPFRLRRCHHVVPQSICRLLNLTSDYSSRAFVRESPESSKPGFSFSFSLSVPLPFPSPPESVRWPMLQPGFS